MENTLSITKREGVTERFSLDKIMNAIVKAFESVKEPVDLGSLAKILSHLDIHNGITVDGPCGHNMHDDNECTT